MKLLLLSLLINLANCWLGYGKNIGHPDYINRKPPPTSAITTSSRIAIIGGGAGGLHMAHELNKRGIHDITIFEEKPEVGGKAQTVTVAKNRRVDSAVIFTNKTPYFMQFLKDLNVDDKLVSFKNCPPTFYDEASGEVFSNEEEMMKSANSTDFPHVDKAYQRALVKYRKLYSEVIDAGTGMPKVEYKHVLSRPFHEFMAEYGFEALQTIVDASITMCGYDSAHLKRRMSTYSALYILNLAPDQMLSYVWEPDFGWQDLWKKAAKSLQEAGISIRRNTRAESVEYLDELEAIAVTAKSMLDGGKTETLFFDFCIFDIPEPHRILRNPTSSQERVLSRFNLFMPTVTSILKVDSQNWPQNCGGILDKNSVYNVNGSKVVATAIGRERKEPSDQSFETVYSTMTSAINEDQLPDIKEKVLDQVEKMEGERPIETLSTKIYNTYFPTCSSDSILEEAPWKLVNLQGENRMWFTSGFASFDSTPPIIRYNHMLLDSIVEE